MNKLVIIAIWTYNQVLIFIISFVIIYMMNLLLTFQAALKNPLSYQSVLKIISDSLVPLHYFTLSVSFPPRDCHLAKIWRKS